MYRTLPALIVAWVLASASAQTVDHRPFNQILRGHVTSDGWVDYASLKRNQRALDAYLDTLDKADLDKLDRDERLAFWINAYNAATLRLILDHYPLKSIMDIPEADRWKARRWHLSGKVYTLDEIENQQIRPVFREPRIHFALNCASVGCPPLRREAYTGAKLEQQLTEQARAVHADPRFLKLTEDAVHLTKLYEWYADDFKQKDKQLLAYPAQFSPTLSARLKQTDQPPAIHYIEYDWTLNDHGGKGTGNREQGTGGPS